MFCPDCGEKNPKNNKFCSSCGASLNSEEVVETIKPKVKGEPKVISILALILSLTVIFSPLGLILSIISLIKCNKYKKATGNRTSYFGLALASLIISIIVTFALAIIIFVVVILALVFYSQDEKLEQTWNCSYGNNSISYVTKIKFDDGDFIWAKYGDEDDNNFSGTYRIKTRKTTNGKNEYVITLKPTHSVINGISSERSKKIDMTIKFDDYNATIDSSAGGDTYYCKKGY